MHYNLAVCFQQINNTKDSIKHNQICLEMNSSLENPRNVDFQIKVLYNLSGLFHKINRINEATSYNKQAQVYNLINKFSKKQKIGRNWKRS